LEGFPEKSGVRSAAFLQILDQRCPWSPFRGKIWQERPQKDKEGFSSADPFGRAIHESVVPGPGGRCPLLDLLQRRRPSDHLVRVLRPPPPPRHAISLSPRGKDPACVGISSMATMYKNLFEIMNQTNATQRRKRQAAFKLAAALFSKEDDRGLFGG